jgi:hypothetical protein
MNVFFALLDVGRGSKHGSQICGVAVRLGRGRLAHIRIYVACSARGTRFPRVFNVLDWALDGSPALAPLLATHDAVATLYEGISGSESESVRQSLWHGSRDPAGLAGLSDGGTDARVDLEDPCVRLAIGAQVE